VPYFYAVTVVTTSGENTEVESVGPVTFYSNFDTIGNAFFIANASVHERNPVLVFNSELESLGKWYRQLLGESIGKEKDKDGNSINFGITPTVSVGSTDLHSMGQLYIGGPKDKLTTFIWAALPKNTQDISSSLFPNLVEGIDGKTTQYVMDAILDGTKNAYEKNKLPFMEVVMENISEKSLGEFMQFKMMEMLYLGKLLNINPFDQPSVEEYKSEVRKILK